MQIKGGAINAHTQQPNNADNHAENKHSRTTVADNLHGKAHSNTGYQRSDNSESVGENGCGEFGFMIPAKIAQLNNTDEDLC